MSEKAWREHGSLYKDAGDVGGDIQCGKAYERRFVHTTLPGRVVDVTAYPVMGDDTTPDIENGEIRVQWQTRTTVCRDIEDPSSTEVWSDTEYSDLPERFDGVYPTVDAAELGAHGLIISMEPKHIGWDGCPDMSLED